MTASGTGTAAVRSDRDGHTLILTINRPEARNAVNLAVAVALGDALDAAEADPDVRVVIITGAGDKAFCAGADLKALAAGEAITPDDSIRAARGFAGVVSHPICKPLIAAVNGYALGGGTEITLASDLAIASQTASFGLPEVRRGIMAAAGGAFRITQQLPTKIGMELLLVGAPIAADRALALGLVNAVVPPADLLPQALTLAWRIAANAPLAVQATKRVAKGIRAGAIGSEAEFWQLNAQERKILSASYDAQEGARAFAENREPVWQAR